MNPYQKYGRIIGDNRRASDGFCNEIGVNIACCSLTSPRATRAREVRSDLAGQPHVRNPRTTIFVQHHVFWLEISVNDALLVEMSNTQHSPRSVVLCHHLRENTEVLKVKPQITCNIESKISIFTTMKTLSL